MASIFGRRAPSGGTASIVTGSLRRPHRRGATGASSAGHWLRARPTQTRTFKDSGLEAQVTGPAQFGGSRYFSDAAATPAARHELVRSTIDCFFNRFPGVLDGIDVDWEFPVAGGLPENKYRAEDKRNYTLLVAEFRDQLDALGERAGR